MILRIYKGITCSLLFAIISLVLLHVFMRVIGKPLFRAEEIERLLFVSMVFLSLGFVTRTEGHIRFDSVLLFFPHRAQTIIQRFINGICALFFGLTTYSAVITLVSNSEAKTASLGIPFLVFALPAALGILLMTIEYLIKTVHPGIPKKTK
ncbi:MAG: TRAP transporter small permease subunit [Spirochaetaceae bacterium]|nr:TRAP transporter small permease subunit [Spirochaetaceae bacterium]